LAIGGAAGYFAGSTFSAGKTTTSSSSISSTTGTQTFGIPTDYYVDPSLSGTTLNMLAANVPELSQVLTWQKVFQAETGITVNVTPIGHNDNATQVGLLLSSKSSQYDLVFGDLFQALAFGYYEAGQIDPFNAWLAKTPAAYNAGDILPPIKRATTAPNGDWFAINMIEPNFTLFTRSDLVPQVPDTYDDLIAAAKKVHNPPDMYGIALIAFPFGMLLSVINPVLYAYNIDIFNPDLVPQMDTTTGHEAIQTMLQLFPLALDPLSADWTATATQFAQGKAATSLNFQGLWGVATGPGSKVTSVAVASQYPKVVSHPNQISGESMLINHYGKNKAAAWSFISWATSPRVQQWLMDSGQGTNRTSVLQNPVSKLTDNISVIAETPVITAGPTFSGADEIAQANLPSIGPTPDTIRQILEKYLAQAVQGQVSVAQCASSMDADLKTYASQSKASSSSSGSSSS
jgi:multiple sugar transport system substrate-binding protein